MARLGCSLSALLFSIVTNGGGIAPSRYVGTIGAKKKGVKFFFKFFFRLVLGRGCGCLGVGAWVWVLGCGGRWVGGSVGRWVGGSVGVGACGWVGRWGGRDGDGRARDEAGWIGIVAVGCARIASLCLPNPNSDCRLVCDG